GGAYPGRLGRCAAGTGHVRLQHRRHARPAHRRVVPLDAAPGTQCQRAGPAVVPVLLRPGLHDDGRTAAGLARARRPAALRRLPRRQGGQGVPRAWAHPSPRGVSASATQPATSTSPESRCTAANPNGRSTVTRTCRTVADGSRTEAAMNPTEVTAAARNPSAVN